MMNNDTSVIRLKDVVPVAPYQFKSSLNFSLERGENWIVNGANGSGKSFLVKIMGGSFLLKNGEISYSFADGDRGRSYDNIRYVNFHDQYGMSTEHVAYQMRWNQGVMDDDMPTVSDVLLRGIDGQDKDVLNRLELGDLLDRKVIMLSSGEFRRFQIAKVLLRQPRVLIIDNPFIGLDNHNRKIVADYFNDLMKGGKLQLILVTCRFPKESLCVSHVVYINDGKVMKMSLQQWRELEHKNSVRINHNIQLPETTIQNHDDMVDDVILQLNNVSIKYGERTILKNLCWTVRKDEKWALKGANGVGKSTLLSLICADNPQGYACNISLFGRRRGSGESIWDIKRHIGFVSPEMYRSYRRSMPVIHIIASGLYDTVGLFRTPKETDLECVRKWMRVFGIEQQATHNYMQLSDGEQRLVLLVRAFVKNPDLLILDEPFHGLDDSFRDLAKTIIESYGSQKGKTIIMVSHYDEDFPLSIKQCLELKRN